MGGPESGEGGEVVVLLAVLGAAVLHAAWNAMAHGVPDRLGGFALLGLSSGTCAIVAVTVTGLPPSSEIG